MDKNYISEIDSFKKLREAKDKSRLEAQLAKNRVELSLFKVRLSLSPSNIASSFSIYIKKTVLKSAFNWVEKKISSKK